MRTTLHATFDAPETGARAVGALIDHGVDPGDVSVFVKDMPVDWEHPGGAADDLQRQAKDGITVTTAQDAVEGGAKGAGIGLGVGALAALASVTIPGAGIVIGGGALSMALGGAVAATAAGAVAGAAVGYLKDQGVDEQTARRFSDHVSGGGALVSVSGPSHDVPLEKIRTILAKYTGHDIVEAGAPATVPPPVPASELRTG
ncbi:MAG: hypothetical protein JST30_09200 [Armatimonadetes bacterium]|nr:hypothetical protein [Armatimonadota bacterium]